MHLPDLLLSLNSHDKVAVCVGGIGGGHLTNSEGTEALGELLVKPDLYLKSVGDLRVQIGLALEHLDLL